MSPGSAAAVALCVAGGLGGAVQAAVMGRFGDRIGTTEAVAFSTLLTAGIAGAVLLVSTRSAGAYGAGVRAPWWMWTAAAMSALIVFGLTYASPRIGVAATIGILVAGNLVMSALIDRYGWFGLAKIPLEWPRVLGLVLLALGAAFTLWRR